MPTSNLELFYKYYKKSVDVRRCIVELQETVAVGGYEYVDQDGEPIEKEGLEFEDILQYGRGADAFIRRFIRDLSIGGNFYCLKLKNKADKLIGFQPLDPRYIGIKANQY